MESPLLKRKRPADVDSPDSHSSGASQSSGAGSTLYSSDSVGSVSSAGQFTTRRKEKTNSKCVYVVY